MSETDQTASEVFDSLTGHDEMAIAQHFGRSVGDLLDDRSMWGRSLIFVFRRRAGDDEDIARNVALDMTLKTVTEFFAPEPEKAGESVEGKGEPVSEAPVSAPLATSLSSVS